MRVDVCPAAMVEAGRGGVWALLADPAAIGGWVDAEFVAAEPPGPVAAGQRLRLRARGLGRWWPVTIEVGEVVPEERLGLDVRLPLGIVNHEVITLAEVGERTTLVRFD